MSNPNQSPKMPEQKALNPHPELVQYKDGEMAIAFRTRGDKVVLEHPANFELRDMVVVETGGGNEYGFGGGLVVDKKRQLAYELSNQSIEVTIGEPCVIPGIDSTHNVKAFLFPYEEKIPNPETVDLRVDDESPFVILQRNLEDLSYNHRQPNSL